MKNADEEEALDAGYYALPSEGERRYMTPQKLAIILSKCTKGSPGFILVEHELNLRLARVQSGATWQAAIAGGAFALVAAGLGAWLTGGWQKDSSNIACNCTGGAQAQAVPVNTTRGSASNPRP